MLFITAAQYTVPVTYNDLEELNRSALYADATYVRMVFQSNRLRLTTALYIGYYVCGMVQQCSAHERTGLFETINHTQLHTFGDVRERLSYHSSCSATFRFFDAGAL